MVEQVQMEGNVTGSEKPSEENISTTEERPEWLPEKFKSGEDLSKAYTELEKKFTQSRQESSDPATESTETSEEVSSENAREVVENAGLDFDKISKEFAENDTLSEETYKEMESKGIPKEMVDSYVEGQRSLGNQYLNEIYGFAGGEETYQEMSQWASDNLAEGEIEAFNKSITSRNQAEARLAIDGLMSRYKMNGGVEPNLVTGRASSSVEAYESWAQVTKDMAKPEYHKDPAFRDAVQKKLSRSKAVM
tara:strand:- start:836 stop:1585 length:750 start_codon:yes stop_codon:yes gene_type:complete